MRLLILGGTVFLGRAIVDAALAAGHEVTIFNRGQSNPGLFDGVEELRGDRREGDLDALLDRDWDAAIDTSGYLPREVRAVTEVLENSVERYTFISTLSVYEDTSQAGITEEAPVAELEGRSVDEVTGETYGALKAVCEEVVAHAFAGHALILRPGLIVGPYDPTDRFTYWPHRVALGGEVLAPGRSGREIQFIDVRDLAEWTLHMTASGQAGTYNADGPHKPLTMGQLLVACQEVSGSDARFIWVAEEFLLEHGVGPWMDLPLWLPEIQPEYAGFFSTDFRKALRAGLTFRPLEETVRATLKWDATRPGDHPWRAGLTLERERALLDAWNNKR